KVLARPVGNDPVFRSELQYMFSAFLVQGKGLQQTGFDEKSVVAYLSCSKQKGAVGDFFKEKVRRQLLKMRFRKARLSRIILIKVAVFQIIIERHTNTVL